MCELRMPRCEGEHFTRKLIKLKLMLTLIQGPGRCLLPLMRQARRNPQLQNWSDIQDVREDLQAKPLQENLQWWQHRITAARNAAVVDRKSNHPTFSENWKILHCQQ